MPTSMVKALVNAGQGIIVRSIETDRVCIEGRICWIFITWWVRAGANEGRNSKLVTTWPGHKDPRIGALLVWQQLVLLEAGRVIRHLVEVGILWQRVRLSWNWKTGVCDDADSFWDIYGGQILHVTDITTAIMVSSSLERIRALRFRSGFCLQCISWHLDYWSFQSQINKCSMV